MAARNGFNGFSGLTERRAAAADPAVAPVLLLLPVAVAAVGNGT